MNQVNKLKKLSNLSYFDKETLSQIVDLSDNSLYANIKRWLKSDHLIQLKRGMYVTGLYLSTLPDKTAYSEFIANKLREPSYLSLEYVLQKYGIISEAVYGFTSVTLKSKKIYTNDLAVFSYNNIKKELFTGYTIKKYGKFLVLEATKAKALFDYLYLKLFRVKIVTKELFDSFRLNLLEIDEKDMMEMKKCSDISGIQKYRLIIEMIGEECDLQKSGKRR